MQTSSGSEITLGGSGMRTRIVSISLLALFGIIGLKGLSVAVSGDDAKIATASVLEPAPRRADIVDRNGDLLATSVTAFSVVADPRAIGAPELVAQELATVLPGIDVDVIAARLSNNQRAFAWVERGITPRQRQAVFELGLEGIEFREESRRAYPRGTLAGHVLGFAGADGQGLGGIEYAQDDRLTSDPAPLYLTIDANVQFSLEAELAAAIGEYEAEAGAGVVMAAQSGEVLGMASWPPLDPHKVPELSTDDPALLDRASGAVFELGSVFKPLTIAGALDAGAIRPGDRFDVREPLQVRGREINDDHPIIGRPTAFEIIADSSNIGTVKIAWQMGSRRSRNFSARLGYFRVRRSSWRAVRGRSCRSGLMIYIAPRRVMGTASRSHRLLLPAHLRRSPMPAKRFRRPSCLLLTVNEIQSGSWQRRQPILSPACCAKLSLTAPARGLKSAATASPARRAQRRSQFRAGIRKPRTFAALPPYSPQIAPNMSY